MNKYLPSVLNPANNLEKKYFEKIKMKQSCLNKVDVK